jgi:hypothetical protein
MSLLKVAKEISRKKYEAGTNRASMAPLKEDAGKIRSWLHGKGLGATSKEYRQAMHATGETGLGTGLLRTGTGLGVGGAIGGAGGYILDRRMGGDGQFGAGMGGTLGMGLGARVGAEYDGYKSQKALDSARKGFNARKGYTTERRKRDGFAGKLGLKKETYHFNEPQKVATSLRDRAVLGGATAVAGSLLGGASGAAAARPGDRGKGALRGAAAGAVMGGGAAALRGDGHWTSAAAGAGGGALAGRFGGKKSAPAQKVASIFEEAAYLNELDKIASDYGVELMPAHYKEALYKEAIMGTIMKGVGDAGTLMSKGVRAVGSKFKPGGAVAGGATRAADFMGKHKELVGAAGLAAGGAVGAAGTGAVFGAGRLSKRSQ